MGLFFALFLVLYPRPPRLFPVVIAAALAKHTHLRVYYAEEYNRQ